MTTSKERMGAKYFHFLAGEIGGERLTNLHEILEFIKTRGSIHNWPCLILLSYWGHIYTSLVNLRQEQKTREG